MSLQLQQIERSVIEYLNPGLDYDNRITKGWAVSSLESAGIALGGYLLMVAYGMWRKSKNAAPLVSDEVIKPIMALYNSAQVLLCAWMAFMAFKIAIVDNSYTFACNEFNQPDTSGLPAVVHVFMLSKVLDFFDTFLIIVRGKWRQLSFLHTYHHFSIMMTYYILTVGAPSGDLWYTVFANSLIHLAMYGYYLLQSAGYSPRWGAWLTRMQMFQFLTMNGQAIYNLSNDCPYPRKISIFYLVYILSLFGLFMSFYLKRWEGKPAATEGAEKRRAVKKTE